ncbi:MAG: tyrosine-type recombinase/integrase [Oscillospiraceae bacterium]|jgi:integrase/recombinase XerD|nr:tyrosine-type recombinase/integrase [Oscillospiraceae bacterium]
MWIRHVEIEDFAARLREDERSAATVEKYCREAARFAAWLEGREVNQVLALEYKAQLAESRTPAGVNGAVAALNKLFSFLGLEGCRLKAVKQQRRIFRDEARELTEHEYRRLLAAARRRGNERLLLLMETVCSTGIRISELRFFTVESAKRGRVEVDNKGKRRTVFLPGKLQTLLLRYARKRGIAEGPVFVTRTGRPLDRSNIWSEMKGLCREAGVEPGKVFPHNLRHLFARTYYGLEKDIVRLADILGHASIETTRIYTMESGYTHRKQLERMRLVM